MPENRQAPVDTTGENTPDERSSAATLHPTSSSVGKSSRGIASFAIAGLALAGVVGVWSWQSSTEDSAPRQRAAVEETTNPEQHSAGPQKSSTHPSSQGSTDTTSAQPTDSRQDSPSSPNTRSNSNDFQVAPLGDSDPYLPPNSWRGKSGSGNISGRKPSQTVIAEAEPQPYNYGQSTGSGEPTDANSGSSVRTGGNGQAGGSSQSTDSAPSTSAPTTDTGDSQPNGSANPGATTSPGNAATGENSPEQSHPGTPNNQETESPNLAHGAGNFLPSPEEIQNAAPSPNKQPLHGEQAPATGNQSQGSGESTAERSAATQQDEASAGAPNEAQQGTDGHSGPATNADSGTDSDAANGGQDQSQNQPQSANQQGPGLPKPGAGLPDLLLSWR